MSACCGPSRPGGAPREDASDAGAIIVGERAEAQPIDELVGRMIQLPGGAFRMGGENPWTYADDGEGPIHEVEVSPFRIAATAVTNAQFAAFADATGYTTDAQRYGWSFVFAGLLPDDFPPTRAVANAPWWRQVEGADWAHPDGPHSNFADRTDHPVVHISWDDARAFCKWAGARLPTEAEWEYAARGGLDGAVFPWGDEREPDGVHRMNVWQGTFPTDNSLADGFLGTAPVGAFAPNDYGLSNMTGNTWEWCSDWYDPTFYRSSRYRDPKGPKGGTHRVMRGGSYLCHESYCNRYRVSARSGNGVDSSTGNLGFRCVIDDR